MGVSLLGSWGHRRGRSSGGDLGRTYPQHEARERLAGLIALERHLGETFEDTEAAGSWLRTGSPYLGGLTPLEALRAGRPDRVRAALEALDSGVFV